MYSGAMMSAKLRSSTRAHRARNVQHAAQIRAQAGINCGVATAGGGNSMYHNLSIFSGGPKLDQDGGSPRDSMQRRNALLPRGSQAKRQWSIQTVRGKVATSCLWNACKALTFGTFLILIGAVMATIGYYAEEDEFRRLNMNATIAEARHAAAVVVVVVANSSSPHMPLPPNTLIRAGRPHPPTPSSAASHNASNAVAQLPFGGLNFGAWGLNKLAYVGPIVMGFGGFVIVAACVMTFEARDSAAKIVPARFRKTETDKPAYKSDEVARCHTDTQTKWETLGVYGDDVGFKHTHDSKEMSRRAMTSAFIKSSKTIQTSMDSSGEYYEQRYIHQQLVKCPSAPSLIREYMLEDKRQPRMEAPRILRVCAQRPHVRRLSTNVLSRQTMSVDNPAVKEVYSCHFPDFIGEQQDDEEMELGASAAVVDRMGSEESLVLDLHLPQCAVTLAIRDNSKSPSTKATIEEEISSTVTEAGDLDEEIPGPSGLQASAKVDKQTSTSDRTHVFSLNYSRDSFDSRDCVDSVCERPGGGSFRERKVSRSGRRVKRSETIDTAATHQHHNRRQHHNQHHHQHIHASDKPSSTRSSTHKLVSSKSEIGRRHQLSRQPKIENRSSNEELKNNDPFHV